MNFEPWRPGNTLIGFPDSSTGGPSVIQNMDQFFALAKESAALADLCISLLIAGDYTAKHKSGPAQFINFRCVVKPIINTSLGRPGSHPSAIPHDVLPPKKETHRFKVDTVQVHIRTECTRCSHPGLYSFNPKGVYYCPSCVRQGFKP